MYTKSDEFENYWNSECGFTLEEAISKQAQVNDAYGVYSPKSKWKPAQIVPDTDRHNGFKVIICRA